MQIPVKSDEAAVMVEVFKTNVNTEYYAEKITDILKRSFPGCKISFDLEDCDRVLRIEGITSGTSRIQDLVNGFGFFCEVLY